MTTEPWVSVEQVAQHFGVAKDTLQEMDALAAANQAQRADLEHLPQRLLAQAFEPAS